MVALRSYGKLYPLCLTGKEQVCKMLEDKLSSNDYSNLNVHFKIRNYQFLFNDISNECSQFYAGPICAPQENYLVYIPNKLVYVYKCMRFFCFRFRY